MFLEINIYILFLNIFWLLFIINNNNLFSIFNLLLKHLNIIILFFFFFILYSFCIFDNSILNIFNHNNISLPIYYKIGSFWSTHDGSILLWVELISLYLISYYTFLNKYITLNYLKMYNMNKLFFNFYLFFFIYLLFFSSIFIKFNEFIQSNLILTLNPILQDLILLIHPIFLYLGYVGLFIPFFIINQKNYYTFNNNFFFLLNKKIKFFVLWILTIGLFLGSWWAYYELGWGGWWFWDPVENIALIPWLILILSIHLNKYFKYSLNFEFFNYILLIINFFFSLLNTCLIRAGIFTSVHSFVNSNIFTNITNICLIYFICLILILIIQKNYQIKYLFVFSIENIYKILIVIMSIIVCFIFIGTFLPIFLSFYRDITIGYNFYHSSIISFIIPLFSIVIFYFLKLKLFYLIQIDLILTSIITLFLINTTNYFIYNLIITFCFIIIYFFYKNYIFGNNFIKNIHVIIFLFIIFIIINFIFETARLIYIFPGEIITFADIFIYFNNIYSIINYKNISEYCEFIIFNNNYYSFFYPEQIIYENKISSFKASIKSNLLYDISIFLTEHELSDNWCFRIKVSPLINFIWLSFIMFIFNFYFFFQKKNKLIQWY